MSLALYEPSRRWLAFVGLVSCQWLLGLSAACAAGDDPRSRLARMHSAAHERNYQGTMVFTTAGVVSSSRVGHFTVGDQSYERIEALDGRMQKIYRHNDAVHTLWPQSGVMVIEKRGAADARALLMQTVEPGALDQYELKPEGQQRVAGRDAEVFLLQPRDELRYAQRLWADVASGLMLRADVINSARQVLESSAFSEVEIGVKAQPESVLQPLRKASNYKVLRANNEPTQLDAQGWLLVRALPGFRMASCVKRPLEAAAVGAAKAAEQTLQVVFSDGLTHVSLFIERFDVERHRKEVQGQLGATSTLMQRRGDHWLTIMGDVPMPTIRLLLEALERRR